MLEKLRSEDIDSQNYVVKYFFGELPVLLPKVIANLNIGNENFKKFKKKMYIESIVKSVLASNESSLLRDKMLSHLSSFPMDWIEAIVEDLKPLKEIDEKYYKKLIEAKIDFPF